MASSSNSTIASQSNAALPLIPCPLCGSRILTDVSKGGRRPGTRYYKCEFFSCSFFSWKEMYARLMEGNGGQGAGAVAGAVAGDVHVAPPAVPQFPRPQQHPDLARANLLLSVTNMMVTFIVLGVLIAILLGHGPQRSLLDIWTSSPVSGGRQGLELAHSSDGTSGGSHGRTHEHIQGQSNDYAPQFTSRISMKHVVDTVAGFTEFKRWLINEIGFGGMLILPMLQKLNLKFSAWIMGRVDVTARAICISETKTLRFRAEDIHKVFGIPCGNRDVRGRDGNITQQSIDFLKMSLGMDRAGAHSLRAAEEFLRRDITEDSSKIDFWGAVANTEHIAQFNWCEYVLQVLLDAVTKLQKDTMNKHAIVNMFGCHIFLPVFMLDNLDLGIFTTKHDVIPRIISFDQVTFRRMTTMASDVRTTPPSYQSVMIRHASNVCYTRSKFVDTPEKAQASQLGGWDTTPALSSPASPPVEPSSRNTTFAPRVTSVPTSGSLGPNDYFAYVHNTYPHLAGDPVLLLMKELNANSIRHIQTARENTQLHMFRFTDRLLSLLAERCICCRIRGHSDCPVKRNNPAEGNPVSTPITEKITPRILDLSENEAESSVDAASSRGKRPMAQGHEPIPPKKTMGTLLSGMNIEQNNRAICTKVKDFSTQLADQIANLYAHLSKNGAQFIFRSKTESLPKRKYISGQTYASNPWMNGNPPPPPVTSIDAALLVDHIRNKSVEEVRSIWIEHAEPRTILVDGLTIRNQLVGNVLLGHELGSIIIRRFAQLDKESENECPYISFKHVMELDFSTLALAEEDMAYVDHIQKQFIQDNLQHRIETCQFIFVPAILEEGWSVYMWDMLSRVIHVLDPRSGPYGYNGGKKERHELIASRLHDALFNCLSEFFAGWPITKDGWGTLFPRITDTYFTRDESAFASLQIIRYYDGAKLRVPLTKFNLGKIKSMALHECLKVRGNRSTLACDVMWNALAPAVNMDDF